MASPPAPVEWHRKRERASFTRDVWRQVLAGVIVALLVGGGATYLLVKDDAAAIPPASTGFSVPASMSAVGSPTEARGTLAEADRASTWWPVVYSHQSGRFYPQDNPIQVEADGTWRATVYVGDEKSGGHKFTLYLVEADDALAAAFRAYLHEGAATPGDAVQRWGGVSEADLAGHRNVAGPTVLRAP